MIDMRDGTKATIAVASIVLVVILLLVGALAAYPQYKVYSKEMSGKASLAEAEWEKQIAIEEAKAELEAAGMLAETEIIRARGIAEANEIIAGSITQEYIQYRFIEGLNDGNTEVIYVPTEANIPVLEAGKQAFAAAAAAEA